MDSHAKLAGKRLYIGLMSGSSLDGVDGVLVSIPDNYIGGVLPILAAFHIPFHETFRSILMSLQTTGENEIEREALVANDLAEIYAKCVHQLLETAGITPDGITAIGVHGQTVRHIPELCITRQTNNPALLAELTGIDVIADFRSRDIAAGGQGAPLVPAFHRAFFENHSESCVVINIGGIANISILSANGTTTGFDTGPGNVLMDTWISKTRGLLYDENGNWAASGKPNMKLLSFLLEEPFLSLFPPKSTGRDLFNQEWLEEKLSLLPEFATLDPADVQATLAVFTADSIARAIRQHAPDAKKIFVCGGGVKNIYLINQLRNILLKLMPETKLVANEENEFDPMHIEALACDWLAHRFINKLPGNIPEVTGAHGLRILGALYPGKIKEYK